MGSGSMGGTEPEGVEEGADRSERMVIGEGLGLELGIAVLPTVEGVSVDELMEEAGGIAGDAGDAEEVAFGELVIGPA